MNEIFQGQLQIDALVIIFFKNVFTKEEKGIIKDNIVDAFLIICYIFYFEWRLCLYFKFNLLRQSPLIMTKR